MCGSHGGGGGRVQHIVQAGHVQLDAAFAREWDAGHIGETRVERHRAAIRGDVAGFDVRFARAAERGDGRQRALDG